MSWIINGVYISDDDCISKTTSDKDSVNKESIRMLHPTSMYIDWE